MMASIAGMIVGTAAYMAPEQARGKPVDRRADIWAFGVILFEMLSGTRAYSGEMLSDVVAAVIMKEPDWNALPARLPRGVRELLDLCLQRDPHERLQDIGDARILIDRCVANPPAMSPDGRHVAFTADKDGRQSLWIRNLDSSTAREFPEQKEPAYRSGSLTDERSPSLQAGS